MLFATKEQIEKHSLELVPIHLNQKKIKNSCFRVKNYLDISLGYQKEKS